jgi:hypothetical protein
LAAKEAVVVSDQMAEIISLLDDYWNVPMELLMQVCSITTFC